MVPVPNGISGVPQSSVLDHYYLFYTLMIYLIMLLVELNYLLIIPKFTLPLRTLLILLQKSLGMVNEWSQKWILKFNADKCKLSQLGNSSPANYTIYLIHPNLLCICRVTEEKILVYGVQVI